MINPDFKPTPGYEKVCPAQCMYDNQRDAFKLYPENYVMPDGRLMPGCSYNNLYRHKDPRFFPRAEPVSPAPVRIDDGKRRLTTLP